MSHVSYGCGSLHVSLHIMLWTSLLRLALVGLQCGVTPDSENLTFSSSGAIDQSSCTGTPLSSTITSPEGIHWHTCTHTLNLKILLFLPFYNTSSLFLCDSHLHKHDNMHNACDLCKFWVALKIAATDVNHFYLLKAKCGFKGFVLCLTFYIVDATVSLFIMHEMWLWT